MFQHPVLPHKNNYILTTGSGLSIMPESIKAPENFFGAL